MSLSFEQKSIVHLPEKRERDGEREMERERLDMGNNRVWNRVNFSRFFLLFFIFSLSLSLIFCLYNTHCHKFNPQQQSGTQFVMTQLIQFFSPSFNPKGRVIFFWGLKKLLKIYIFPLKSLSSSASAILFRWFSNWWFVIVTATKNLHFFLEIILNNG